MANPHETPAVLAAWSRSLTPQYCEFLDNAGGYSGAKFWKLSSERGDFCLRRWPQEHPSPERLAWIHAVIEHAAQTCDVPLAPAIRTDSGKTFVEYAGHLWELTPWLPGEPYDFTHSDSSSFAKDDWVMQGVAAHKVVPKIIGAASALAKFHAATASFPQNNSLPKCFTPEGKQLPANWGVSPGMNERWNRLQVLNATQLALLRSAILKSSRWPSGVPMALEVLELVPKALPSLFEIVEPCIKLEVALQPCLRDIWSDHILFSEEKVSGLIDYGAMGMENIAADFSRLIASIAFNNLERWKLAAQGYNAISPFSPIERQLVEAFDATQVVFSGLNWIEWIFVEQREFPDMKSIERRMQGILARLRKRAKG